MKGQDESDRELEPLLRQVLRSSSAASGDACPGDDIADTLAAWADGTLRADERVAFESHAADCPRCRAMMAAFIRSDVPAPLPGAAASPSVADVDPEPFWRRWRLNWLVPVAATATALAVYIAAPTPPDKASAPAEQSAKVDAGQSNAAPGNAAQETMSADKQTAAAPSVDALSQPVSPAPNGASSSAGANAPAATPAPTSAPAPSAAQAQPQATGRLQDRAEAEAPRAGAGAGAASSERFAPVPDQLTAAKSAPASAADAAARPTAAPLPSAPIATAAAPAPAPAPAAAPAGAAAAAPAQARALRETATTQNELRRDDSAAAESRFRQAEAPRLLPFAGGIARWRVNGARLERSAPGARDGNDGSWTPVALAPGVEPSQLTAGSTAGGATWLVGRNGLVLVAEGSNNFTRMRAPAAADLVSVTAVDARRATVVATGGQAFVTTDAGQTWTPQ